MIDYVEIGSVPFGEDCVTVSRDYDYIPGMTRECKMFKKQLKEQFPQVPYGAGFTIKTFPHDFGSYKEVCVQFDDDIEGSEDFACRVESETPEFWDVGYAFPVSLNEFDSPDMSPLFKKAFGNTNERVVLVKIYTKDCHTDIFMDLDYLDDKTQEYINNKDSDNLINHLRLNDWGRYYIIRREFDR